MSGSPAQTLDQSLFIALQRKCLAEATRLLKLGAQPSAVEHKTGDTIWHVCARNGTTTFLMNLSHSSEENKSIAEIFKPAFLIQRNKQHLTALSEAVRLSNIQSVSHLSQLLGNALRDPLADAQTKLSIKDSIAASTAIAGSFLHYEALECLLDAGASCSDYMRFLTNNSQKPREKQIAFAQFLLRRNLIRFSGDLLVHLKELVRNRSLAAPTLIAVAPINLVKTTDLFSLALSLKSWEVVSALLDRFIADPIDVIRESDMFHTLARHPEANEALARALCLPRDRFPCDEMRPARGTRLWAQPWRWTPARVAFQHSQENFELLMKAGANVDTAFALCCIHPPPLDFKCTNPSHASLLRQYAASPGWPPEALARDPSNIATSVMARHIECFRILASVRKGFPWTDSNGNNIFHVICGYDVPECLSEALSIFKASKCRPYVYAKNDAGNTPFHLAVQNGAAECIDILLKHFDVDNSENKARETPLTIAVTSFFDRKPRPPPLFPHLGHTGYFQTRTLAPALALIHKGGDCDFASIYDLVFRTPHAADDKRHSDWFNIFRKLCMRDMAVCSALQHFTLSDLVVPVVSYYSGWPPENVNVSCPTCLREISRLPSVRKQIVKGLRDSS